MAIDNKYNYGGMAGLNATNSGMGVGGSMDQAGAVAGGAAGAGGASGPRRIGKMRRQFVKQRFRDMMEGNLVGDREKRAYEQQSIDAAQQAQAAQDTAAARIAAAIAGGNPLLSGAIAGGVEGLGEANRQAAAKASSDTNKLSAALKDQREAQTLAAGERLIASNKEDVAMGVDTALKIADIGTQIANLGNA